MLVCCVIFGSAEVKDGVPCDRTVYQEECGLGCRF